MRKVILLYSFLMVSFVVVAQQRISLAAGLHSSSVAPYWKLQPGATSQLMQAKGGFHLGLIADLPIKYFGWHFQPGVLYNNKGAKQQQAFDPDTAKLSYYSYSQNINYIDVPLNLVYKFYSPSNARFMLGGGPYASFHYAGTQSYNSMDIFGNLTYDSNKDLPVGKGDNEFRTIHYGLNLMAGVEFKNVFLTANYNKGLTSYFNQDGKKFKYGTIGATIGFYLSGPKKEDRDAKDRIYYCPDWW
jgi:OmpA-OmpF porin, OOP family